MATVRQRPATERIETIIETAQEEAQRTRERIRKGIDILLARDEPKVGVTPLALLPVT